MMEQEEQELEQFYEQELLKDHHQKLVLKRKRTKRQRPMSPLVLTMATTTSSCSTGSGGDGGFCDLQLFCGGGSGRDRFSGSTSNNSGEFIQSKVDEEDMAKCLILLAQGQRQHQSSTTELAGINDYAKTVPDVYECKTCNRRFHSFQALGGHRASHRKPKLDLSKEKKVENYKISNTSLSLQVYRGKDSCSNNNKSRAHECLICGAEFNSGQALGGHMRRHRPLPVAGAGARSITPDDTQEAKKSRLELLGLDLNLPAPEDDQSRGSKFSFASKDQVPVFATSQLVHCHY